MVKYLEISDFHFSNKWKKESLMCAEAVKNAAMRENVDFIAITGDFFDSPIYATRSGGIEDAKEIIKSWSDIAPIACIEGTPSHDAPGCYEIFSEFNFALLKPNKVYGLFGSRIIDVKSVPNEDPTSILVGVPELSKRNIQSKLGLPADEANAKTVELFKSYVKDFIAPTRQKYSDVPAIGLLHGNVSDSERSNETDIILKASDIVIYTEDLEPAGLDRWSLGHIHAPWESKKINAGYAGFPGIDKNPWGKRDFVPAFNLVEDGKVSRIPYGTPERRKVKHSSDILPFDNAAWWIDTEDHDDQLPEGLHPWSRITYRTKEEKTRRVESTEEVKSLWDLFLLIGCTDENLKPLVDQITETVKHNPPCRKDVAVTEVEIAGCKLFKGKTIKLNVKDIESGLTLITGQNGDGKSSLLSFCSPYPHVIGKDKGNVLKNFFNRKDSWIKKTVYLNGEKHEHLITIRGAHTKSAKTECYLTVNGDPHMDKATLTEMMETCENLYGSMHDYRITSFCEQPQQAVSNVSGLMSAKPIEARNIVQAIAGVDREQEKRFALDKVSEIEKYIVKIEAKREALTESLPDFEALASETESANESISKAEYDLGEIKEAGERERVELDRLEAAKAKYDRKVELLGKVKTGQKRLEQIKSITESAGSNKASIEHDDNARAKVAEIEKIEKRNLELSLAYSEKLTPYREEISRIDSETLRLKDKIKREAEELDRLKNDVESAEKAISGLDRNKELLKAKKDNERAGLLRKELDILDKPCEHCGKLPTSSAGRVAELKTELNGLTLSEADIPPNLESLIARAELALKGIEDLRARRTILQRSTTSSDLESLVRPEAPVPPEYEEVPQKPSVLSDFERSAILDDIEAAGKAESEAGQIRTNIEQWNNEAGLITVLPLIIDQVRASEGRIESLRDQYTNQSVLVEKLKGERDAIVRRIVEGESKEKEIEQLAEQVKGSRLEDWKYIAKMLGSDKIPALELDMFLGTIDREATENIEPFQESRFAIETTTQENGVDRFDIIVTDRQDGEELSLFQWNPGNKAFFSDAYIKALIKQRNSRMQRSYSPIIFDESDSPIKEDRIPMFYEINRKYFSNAKVLVVSQKDSAVNYMAGVIDINSLKEG